MTKKTVADRIWTLIGILGVMCIGIAIYLLAADIFKSTPAEEAQERWEEGRAKLAADDVKGALVDLQAAVDITGGLHPVYRTDLGIALLKSGKPNLAAAHWHNAFRLNPVYARPYGLLADLLESRGEKGAALAFYRAALALHPEPVPEGLPEKVIELKAGIEEVRAEQQAAVRDELRANPAALGAFLMLLLDELSEMGVAEDAPPRAGIEAALLAMGKQITDLPDLIERQRGAVSDRPESVLDRAGLGNLLLISGDFEAARTVFGEAIEISAKDPAALVGASLSDLVTGAAGIERIQQAAARLGKDPSSWLALGAADLRSDRPEPARKALFHALKINPAVPEVYRLLALSFTGDELKKDREAALRAYRRLLE